MALSVFLRSSVCTSKAFSHQLRHLTTQSILNTTVLRPSASIIKIKDETTPIYNAVRPFQTSTIRLSGEKAHDHTKLWVIEKATSALLVPLIPMALLMPNKLFDSTLAILIVAHSFWGMEAMVVEYVRVLLFGPTIPKIAIGVVYFLTVLLLGGLFFLIFNDIGMARAFWRIWRNMRKPPATQVTCLIITIVDIFKYWWLLEFGITTSPAFFTMRGLEAIAVDYVRASIFGPIIPKIAIGLVYLISIATLGGLFYIITHDIGLANTIKQFWAIKSEQKA